MGGFFGFCPSLLLFLFFLFFFFFFPFFPFFLFFQLIFCFSVVGKGKRRERREKRRERKEEQSTLPVLASKRQTFLNCFLHLPTWRSHQAPASNQDRDTTLFFSPQSPTLRFPLLFLPLWLANLNPFFPCLFSPPFHPWQPRQRRHR